MLYAPAHPRDWKLPAPKILLAPVLALLCTGLIWFGTELPQNAKFALLIFALAVVGWVFTKINDTYIALGAAIALTLSGVQSSEALFSSLGDSMIWLLLAAFIVAAAVKASGLANRIAALVAAKTRTTNGLFYSLTGVILLTAFFIPSTSGRAALLVPVFVALAGAIQNPRVVKALAILFPTIILLSAVASLIGAGAHLVTADIVARVSGERIDFLRWALMGTPLALVSCYGSAWVILRVFLTKAERLEPLDFASSASPDLQPKGKLEGVELYTLFTVVALVALWATEGVHGIDSTIVALVGALAVTYPQVGAINFKDALKSVEWNTLLFMAATLELGEALVSSGSAKAIVEGLFATLGNTASSPLVIVGAVVGLSLVAHLVVVSRTARSSVLVPLVIALAIGLGYSPTALAFASTAAAGYCLTLIVSAKPLTIFSGLAFPTFEARDLMRLSSILMPLHALVFATFTLVVWPAMGMSLTKSIAPEAPILNPKQSTVKPPNPSSQAKPAVLKATPATTPRTITSRPTSIKPSAPNASRVLSASGNLSSDAGRATQRVPVASTVRAAPSRTVPNNTVPRAARPSPNQVVRATPSRSSVTRAMPNRTTAKPAVKPPSRNVRPANTNARPIQRSSSGNLGSIWRAVPRTNSSSTTVSTPKISAPPRAVGVPIAEPRVRPGADDDDDGDD